MSDENESEFYNALHKIENAIELMKQANPNWEYERQVINSAFNNWFMAHIRFGQMIEQLQKNGYSEDEIIQIIEECGNAETD